MKAVVTLLLILTCHISVGQKDSYVDSLEQILTEKISDTLRAKIYIDLAEYIMDEKVWMEYNTKALDLANMRLKSGKRRYRKFYLSIKAHAIGNRGYYYDDHGDKMKSLDNYFKSLELYGLAGDEEGKASVYGNIGIVFTDQGDFVEALDYFQKALVIKNKYAPDQVAKNYINIGSAYQGMKDTVKAMNYYEKALSAALKVDNTLDIATANNNIGSMYFGQKDYQKSILLLKKAIEFYRKGGDEPGVAWSMANLGSSYFNLGEMDSAYYYKLKAKEISDLYGYPELTQSIAEKLAEMYLYNDDWENAFKSYQESIHMRDSLQNLDVQKAALIQKMDFDHNIEKATLKMEREADRKRAEQQFYFIFTGMLMALTFAGIIYSRLRVTKRQKRTIEQQKAEVE